MKAYALYGVNDLRYEERPLPDCPPGWVLVQVRAAGICSSDIPRIFTKGTYHFPTVPGHEFSGVVYQAEAAADQRLVGKRVGVFPLIPCRTCPQCRQGLYEMCAHYDYIGSRRDGGFAEYVAVPAWNLVELPDTVSLEEAAMMEPLAVALHAIRQGGVQAGARVAIVGTGMIGFAAAQWAVKLGAAQVTVLGRTQRKRTIADGLPGVRYGLVEEEQAEFDVVLEAVGTSQAIDAAIRQVRPAGTLVLMGNPAGDITLAQDTYWRILRKQLRVSGTWNSTYRPGAPSDWSEVTDALACGALQVGPLISHRFPQSELARGLSIMREHQQPYCKIMTLWNGEPAGEEQA